MSWETTRDVYLVLARFRTHVRGHLGAVERMPQLASPGELRVQVWHRGIRDTVLVRLRLHTPEPWQLAAVVVWALSEDLRVIDMASLPPNRRREFVDRYLPQFGLVADNFDSATGALRAAFDALNAHPHPYLEPPALSPDRDARITERFTKEASGTIGDGNSDAASGRLPASAPGLRCA